MNVSKVIMIYLATYVGLLPFLNISEDLFSVPMYTKITYDWMASI